MYDMTGKVETYGNRLVSVIITIPQFANEKTLWFYNLNLVTSGLWGNSFYVPPGYYSNLFSDNVVFVCRVVC